jgi:hypothetical protein
VPTPCSTQCWGTGLTCGTLSAPEAKNTVVSFTFSYVGLSSDAQFLKVTSVREGPVALLAGRFGDEHEYLAGSSDGLVRGRLDALQEKGQIPAEQSLHRLSNIAPHA